MVKIKKRKKGEIEIPSSSMSDIAFLLLIFFLVSTVIDVDTGIGLTLPDYVPPEEMVVAEISKDRLVNLLINEQGDVLMNKEVIAIPQIRENLKARIESKINLPKNKKLIVSVKTDRKTNYNLYIQALDAVKGAYFDVREVYAMGKWGMKLYDLNEEQNDELKDKIPIIISIAEPELVRR
jgi:biopolymer transport protein ExbD